MKICRMVLLLTLGASAGAVWETRQMLPADTVMVASETMPGGVELFPELLASSHQALLQGLPMTPAISEGVLSPPAKTETTPKPLTGMDRLTLFWNESYASPGAFVGVSVGALAISSGIHRPSGMETEVGTPGVSPANTASWPRAMSFTTA